MSEAVGVLSRLDVIPPVEGNKTWLTIQESGYWLIGTYLLDNQIVIFQGHQEASPSHLSFLRENWGIFFSAALLSPFSFTQ